MATVRSPSRSESSRPARNLSGRARFGSLDAGFTLLELMVAIAILGILSAAVAPLAAQYVDQQRRATAREEIVQMHQAIWGARETPGFVADIGRLPNTLAELATRGALPLGTTATVASVRMGWSGSYINLGFDAASQLRDPWGSAYLYGAAAGLQAGQIRSPGPDRQSGTSDDMTYPTEAYSATGALRVNLHVWHTGKGVYVTNPAHASDTAQATTVTVYAATNGAQSSSALSTTSTGNPPFLFSAHRGHHAVVVTSTYKGASPALATTVVAFVEGNARQTTIDVYLGGAGS